MNEFALKESSCGDHTLSILVDDDLIRVARIERVGASPSVNDVLATCRALTWFSSEIGLARRLQRTVGCFRGILNFDIHD